MTTSAKKVVLFGAGATARGHVGLLAWQAGYELVFVEKNPLMVDLLRQAGAYRVRLFGGGRPVGKYDEVRVSGYRVLHSIERRAVAREIVGAALVLTAVFDQNLPDVAETLALAVKECRKAGRSEPLNVIACENMMDSSSVLGSHVLNRLKGEDANYCHEIFGFPDCMISRVVPRPEEDPLLILTEDYNEWTARWEAYKGARLAGLDALELVDNQTARLERKLFIHNGGHAVCGYAGFERGFKYIHEAVADPEVLRLVGGALDELCQVVERKHGFEAQALADYAADLGRRGAIAELKDDILRVVRDPIRKLSAHERLVAPALLAVEYDLPRRWIVRGITSALRYRHPADAQSLRLGQMISDKGLEAVLAGVCEIPAGSPLMDEIMVTFREKLPE
jgi:mannitol-1-phosphate 5-dehydrogenase